MIKKSLSPKLKEIMENELKILQEVDNPYVMRIYELLEDRNQYYVVSELVKDGELKDLLDDRLWYNQPFTEAELAKLAV